MSVTALLSENPHTIVHAVSTDLKMWTGHTFGELSEERLHNLYKLRWFNNI